MGTRGQFLLHCVGRWPQALSFLCADAGAPVYFYEFQHGPQCLKDRRPAFVKADHSDEIRFVFGGAFLKGDVVMFGKERASGGLLLLWGLELGISWGEALGPPDVMQEPP